MKHSYVTLYCSRFKEIPIGEIGNKLIIVKSLILLSLPQLIWLSSYIYFFPCVGLCEDVYVSTSITVHFHICYLPCMILWLMNFHHHWISLMSTPWNKFSNVLTAYVIWYDSFCALKKFIYNWISKCNYVSLMSKPWK